jgi:alpha-glucosidase
LGNHDQPRLAGRIGAAQARVAAMMLLTLRGTPTIYYGEEIGMVDVPIPPDRVRDPAEKNQPGIGMGRDPQRTPMRWDDSPLAGFTTGEPWLPIGDGGPSVAAQQDDPASMLALYRALIALRQGSAALTGGAIESIEVLGPVLAYRRRQGAEEVTVLLNLGAEPQSLPAPPGAFALSTLGDAPPIADGRLALRGDEGVVYRSGG